MDKTICRVCRAKERVMVNIFEVPPGSSISIADMISQCTGICISQMQTYPKVICRPCMLDAQKAYEFKRTFERSHQYFSQIKEEVCILDGDEETDQVKDEFEICFLEEEESKVGSFTDQLKNKPTEEPLLMEDQFLVSGISEANPSEGTDDRDDNDATSFAADRPYKCYHCLKAFTRKHHLDRHIRMHTGERPYQCEQCRKSYAHKHSLKTHLLMHTGERPFNCSHCPKSFSSSSNLKTHISTHLGIRHKCSECPKSFSTAFTLKTHLFTHFDTKMDVERHIVIQTEKQRLIRKTRLLKEHN